MRSRKRRFGLHSAQNPRIDWRRILRQPLTESRSCQSRERLAGRTEGNLLSNDRHSFYLFANEPVLELCSGRHLKENYLSLPVNFHWLFRGITINWLVDRGICSATRFLSVYRDHRPPPRYSPEVEMCPSKMIQSHIPRHQVSGQRQALRCTTRTVYYKIQ